MTISKNTMKKPVWLKYTSDEVKQIVLKLVEKDPEMTAEKIGLVLRDNYGIPKVSLFDLKISKILKEAGKYKSPDLANLEKKNKKLENHIIKNHGDKKTKRSLIITKAKLKILKDYFKKSEKKK
jgi:ribosomal protein S15P/S13E